MVQALGRCAGLALGRAIVHDKSGDTDAASTIGARNTILLLSPAIAPVSDLWVAEWVGWRVVSVLLVCIGAVAPASTAFLISETSGRTADPLREKVRRYGRLLSSGSFVAPLVASALRTTTMFAVLSVSLVVVTHNPGRPLGEAGTSIAPS